MQNLKRQSYYSLTAKFLSAVFGVAILIAVPLSWGVETYGYFTLLISYVTLFEIFFGNAINTAIKKEVAENKYSEAGARMFVAGLQTKMVFFFFGLVLSSVFLFIFPITIIIENYFYFISLLFLMNFWGLIVNCFEAAHDIGYVLLMYIVEYVTKFALLAYFIFSENTTLATIMVVMILGYCATFLFGAYHFSNKLNLRRYIFSLQLDKDLFSSFLVRSFHLSLATASLVLLTRIDVVILAYYTDTQTVGFYAIAAEIARNSGIVGMALVAAIAPLFVDRKIERLGFFKSQTVKLLLINLSISLVIVLGASVFVKSLYGLDFLPVVAILYALSLYPVLATLQVFSGEILNLKGQTSVIFKNGFISVALNIFLSLILVQHYGAVGVGIATIISYATWSLLNTVKTYSLLKAESA